MPSKSKRQKARAKHQLQKRRAKCFRIMDKYADGGVSGLKTERFQLMVNELSTLNVKYLATLLNDLKTSGYMWKWSGDYHRQLQHFVESCILERTLLK